MFRPTNKPAQAAQNRQTYIPPDVAKAMGEHMQRSMPAHLKQYQGGGTYVPQRAENEMTKHLEASLPAHMKQYAGAYMQQNVVQPGLERASAAPQPYAGPAGPVPHAPSIRPQENYTPNPAVPHDRTAPDQPYNFITNPEPPVKQSLMSRLPGSNSIAVRIGFAAGGLLILLILFSVIKGALGGSSNLDSFVTIAQDQQELIHLATNAGQQPDISTGNKNLAATMQTALSSSQAKTISYLGSNHKKINTKTLNLKISITTDNQLTAAAAATTYNQTFQEVIQAKLTDYGKVLQQTYKIDNGKKGRDLLSDSYRQAQLFQVQLATPAN